MKRLSLLSTAVLAVVFALPAHAGKNKPNQTNSARSPVDRIEGKWKDRDFECNKASGKITVMGDRVQFEWPYNAFRATSGSGGRDSSSQSGEYYITYTMAVEKVTSVTGDEFETTLISSGGKPPEKEKRYRYLVKGNKLLITDLSDNTESLHERCP